MTPEQIELVQSTWAKVAPNADQVAALFYDRLFEIAPEVKPLFDVDMLEQGRKLMQVINTAVGSLDDLEAMLPEVRAMGARHVGYGVEEPHYAAVGAALVWTLEQGLRDGFTDEAKEAWIETFDTIAAVMKKAAATATAESAVA